MSKRDRLDRVSALLEEVDSLVKGISSVEDKDITKAFANLATVSELLSERLAQVSQDFPRRKASKFSDLSEGFRDTAEEVAAVAEGLNEGKIRSTKAELEEYFKGHLANVLDGLEIFEASKKEQEEPEETEEDDDEGEEEAKKEWRRRRLDRLEAKMKEKGEGEPEETEDEDEDEKAKKEWRSRRMERQLRRLEAKKEQEELETDDDDEDDLETDLEKKERKDKREWMAIRRMRERLEAKKAESDEDYEEEEDEKKDKTESKEDPKDKLEEAIQLMRESFSRGKERSRT